MGAWLIAGEILEDVHGNERVEELVSLRSTSRRNDRERNLFIEK